MSTIVGKQIKDFIERFEEYDAATNSGLCSTYMRIQVQLDVQQLLKWWKSIKRREGK